jgi:hypothetical protein
MSSSSPLSRSCFRRFAAQRCAWCGAGQAWHASLASSTSTRTCALWCESVWCSTDCLRSSMSMSTKCGKGTKSCMGMTRSHTQTTQTSRAPIRITSTFHQRSNTTASRHPTCIAPNPIFQCSFGKSKRRYYKHSGMVRQSRETRRRPARATSSSTTPSSRPSWRRHDLARLGFSQPGTRP